MVGYLLGSKRAEKRLQVYTPAGLCIDWKASLVQVLSKEVLSKFRNPDAFKFGLEDCLLRDGGKPENQKFRRLAFIRSSCRFAVHQPFAVVLYPPHRTPFLEINSTCAAGSTHIIFPHSLSIASRVK
jgi:hypothetical protein